MMWTLAHACAVVVIVSLYARYPDYGRALWHCLRRYSTLRPCDIDFHDKARATLTSMCMRVNIRVARIVHRNFEVVSVFSVILFAVFLWNLLWGIVQIVWFFVSTGVLL